MGAIITKANNDGVSWCECEHAVASYPGQLSCPWCGCGWLFSCLECRKAFTFGKMVQAEQPVVDLAKRDLELRGLKYEAELVEEWVDYHDYLSEYLPLNEEIVYLDGYAFLTDKTDLNFKGWYAEHSLAALPHRFRTKEALEKALGNTDYWTSRERQDRRS